MRGKKCIKNDIVDFATLTDTEKSQDFTYALIKTLITITNNRHLVSQSLAGFNNALLMHHQTLQLPVSDPLGFEDYQAFTNRIKEAIAGNTNMAPLPLHDFMPVRSGTMRLHKLHIVDTFGQVKEDIPLTNMLKSESLSLPAISNANANDAWLSPRIVQPARINFRWLSANSGTQELNTHPESSPHLRMAPGQPSGQQSGGIRPGRNCHRYY